MISSETFHVVTTELVVGAYSVSGLCFALCFLIHFGLLKRTEWMSMFDNVAHFTLVFGLAATPFAILSGVSSSPGEGLSSPLLVNKMFLSMAGAGFAIGTALSRWRLGKGLWILLLRHESIALRDLRLAAQCCSQHLLEVLSLEENLFWMYFSYRMSRCCCFHLPLASSHLF